MVKQMVPGSLPAQKFVLLYCYYILQEIKNCSFWRLLSFIVFFYNRSPVSKTVARRHNERLMILSACHFHFKEEMYGKIGGSEKMFNTEPTKLLISVNITMYVVSYST